jgi:hypothetical protein
MFSHLDAVADRLAAVRADLENYLAESKASEQRIDAALSRMFDLEPARVFAERSLTAGLATCWD